MAYNEKITTTEGDNLKKPLVLALILAGTYIAADTIAIVKGTMDAKKKTDALEARMVVFREAAAERIRKIEEQEDYDIKFDLIVNSNYN